MEHQYTQTGSLLGAGMGASLSEAKTDKVGEPQCKSGASHPTDLALCVVCPFLSLLSLQSLQKYLLTGIEPGFRTWLLQLL